MFNAVIGLGQAGCAIATVFSELSGYGKIFRIDKDNLENNSKCIDIPVGAQSKAEDYEQNFPSLKKYFNDLNGNILFVCAGGGDITLASLVLLSQLKENCKITVLYIKPDDTFFGAHAKMKEKLIFNVFQQYARSGLFERLYIVSNIEVEKAMGGVSIIRYFEKINETIVSIFNTLYKFKNMKAVNSTIAELPPGARISTFGVVNEETNEENFFFDLEFVSDSMYYYGYNESILSENNTLLYDIRNNLKDKFEKGINRVSYGIYATNYDNTIIICENHSSLTHDEIRS